MVIPNWVSGSLLEKLNRSAAFILFKILKSKVSLYILKKISPMISLYPRK